MNPEDPAPFQFVEQMAFPCGKCGRDLFYHQPDPAGGANIQVPKPGLSLKQFNRAERFAYAVCPSCAHETMIDMAYFGQD